MARLPSSSPTSPTATSRSGRCSGGRFDDPEEPTEPPGDGIGKLVGIPLPNDPALPFNTQRACKHVNLASDGKHLYASGGDWGNSATDGTARMNLATGAWELCIGKPPGVRAPHALQDGAGFEYIEGLDRFLLWPGIYLGYEKPGAPVLDFARGMWWLDPQTLTYLHDTRLFGAYQSGTGCPFGGVLDKQRMHIIAFGDGAVRRWDLGKGERLPNIEFRLARDPEATGTHYQRTRPVMIGRSVYVLGFRSDGGKVQKPLFLRYDADTGKVVELTPPPVGAKGMPPDIEIRLVVSHSKVVWPRTHGPEGDIDGIAVYDTKADTWSVDTQVPKVGEFLCNAVCSLPDGRAVLAGGVFGKQQTHLWFYEAA
jgi:hypothetical protein